MNIHLVYQLGSVQIDSFNLQTGNHYSIGKLATQSNQTQHLISTTTEDNISLPKQLPMQESKIILCLSTFILIVGRKYKDNTKCYIDQNISPSP